MSSFINNKLVFFPGKRCRIWRHVLSWTCSWLFYSLLHAVQQGLYKSFNRKGDIITRQTFTAAEAMLSESGYLRVRRSYIILLRKLRSFTTDTVEIGDTELPIGKLYRNQFLKMQGS